MGRECASPKNACKFQAFCSHISKTGRYGTNTWRSGERVRGLRRQHLEVRTKHPKLGSCLSSGRPSFPLGDIA